MEIATGEHRTANYTTFSVNDEQSSYVLTVKGYSGDAGREFHEDFVHKYIILNE